MNIIGNNCGGATYYNLHKFPYNNPFMWCCTFASDMINLIANYDQLDWTKYQLIQLDYVTAKHNGFYEFNPTQCGIRIGDAVNTYFVHYLYDSNAATPYSKGPDKFYVKNFQYTYEKYIERLNRMLLLQEPPMFMVIAYHRHGWTPSLISNLVEIGTKYKVVVITDVPTVSKKQNIKVIYNEKLNTITELAPVVQVRRYFNDLNEFYGVH